MQFDFGELPSSCKLKTEGGQTRSSSVVNESPKRSKRFRSVGHGHGQKQTLAPPDDEDHDRITWQNSSSSPVHAQAPVPASTTSLSRLRDLSRSFYDTNDPASELRAKFVPNRNSNNSTVSTKRKKKAGKLMSLPASRTAKSDLNSMIDKALDNLDGQNDGDTSKSLPSSPPLGGGVASDSESDEDIDWNELEREAETQIQSQYQQQYRTSPKKVVSTKDILEDLSDIDMDDIEKGLPSSSDIDDDDDDDDDDIDLGMLEQEVKVKKAEERAVFREDAKPKARNDESESIDCVIERKDFQRLIVQSAAISEYENSKGRLDEQYTLVAYGKYGQKTVHLRDVWLLSCPEKGDVIHIIGETDHSKKEIIVDNHQNLLVTHPDYLVTITNVADSFYCTRKTAIRDRIREMGQTAWSKQLLFGDLIHGLFEWCLVNRNFKRPDMRKQLESIIREGYTESVVMLELSIEELLSEMDAKIGQLIKFRNLYVHGKPHAASKVQEHRLNKQGLVSVSSVLDTEEQIWSPLFGLQGKIDVTVETAYKEADGSLIKRIAPLELKTAQFNRTVGHFAQTTLYTLLMSDRYNTDVEYGLLFYSETCELHRVKKFHDEVAALLAQRNYLAKFMKTRQGLPEPLQDDRRCTRCNQQAECMVFHKIMEQGSPETAGTDNMFLNHTDHLTSHHMDFFKHWDDLLDKEGMEGTKFRKEIWTMDSKSREEVGRGFGNLRIKPKYGIKMITDNACHYILERTNGDTSPLKSAASMISVRDRIIVSDESGHICLAHGHIVRINDREIEIVVYQRLENALKKKQDYDDRTNQVYVPRIKSMEHSTATGNAVFRIDTDPFEKGMALARSNIMELLRIDGSSNLRRLIVDMEPPKFSSRPIEHEIDRSKFNPDQLKAVDLVMKTQDYSLILGMPGTGKTTTIAGIIKSLVAAGKTILLSSYTHSAVDNICLKIRDSGFGVCRLTGYLGNVHPECQDLVPMPDNNQELTREIIEKKYFDPPVVATTCLSITHWLLGMRRFDYCIVDEASQLTLPVCLGPLRFADKFILVGDHYQLQPMVKSAEAAQNGLKQSLFERLSIHHPQASVNLAHQYRMCKDIMLLSNELVYEGKLECGSEEVANQSLHIPKPQKIVDQMINSSNTNDWISHVAEPSNRVIFLNTDAVDDAHELLQSSRIINPKEAEIVRQLVEVLCEAGVSEDDLGIITVYRQQLKLLNQLLRNRKYIEALTADRFQGRDKNCIIISLVRNNQEGNIGELLNDWRRLNVTFTRAKSKLVLIGSRKTLEGEPRLQQFLSLIDQRAWSYNLPHNCTELYHVTPALLYTPRKTQTQTQTQTQSQAPNGLPESPTSRKTPKQNVVSTRVMESNALVRDIMNDMK